LTVLRCEQRRLDGLEADVLQQHLRLERRENRVEHDRRHRL
tara:strand:+ start:336 stop:458 length:123 start_codon:yes stop_codon:yes gene_type:complete